MEISIKWNVCRVCLTEDNPSEGLEMHEIFSDDKLAKQIYDCSGVEIKQGDNLPEKVCKNCLVILKQAYKFRSTCRNSDKYLQTIVQKTKSASSLFKVEKKERKIELESVESEFEDVQMEEYVIPSNDMSNNDEDDVDDHDSDSKYNENYDKDTKEAMHSEAKNESSKSRTTKTTEKQVYHDKSVKKSSELHKTKEEEENSQMETVAEESVDDDVIFLLRENIIKQENDEEECSENYEIEEQSYSDDNTVSRYTYDNEECLAVDGNTDNYLEEQLVIKPVKKYERSPKTTNYVFICDICGNNFQKRSLLNFHMKIHRNEKRFGCEFCEKRFNSACNLTAHMRTHTGEKPFSCQYCQRRFSDRSTQKKHERIHTNEKPFKCETCNKCFSLSTTLKAHEKIHSGEKPHKCETCEKAFTLPHQLKAHLSTHIHRMLKSST